LSEIEAPLRPELPGTMAAFAAGNFRPQNKTDASDQESVRRQIKKN
jgi:hypothetical protein